MTKDELISLITLENYEIRELLGSMKKRMRDIRLKCVCIGGPLNDNKKQYSNEQLKDWREILNIAESMNYDLKNFREDDDS